jgi:hypothetical protein
VTRVIIDYSLFSHVPRKAANTERVGSRWVKERVRSRGFGVAIKSSEGGCSDYGGAFLMHICFTSIFFILVLHLSLILFPIRIN